MGLRGPGAKPVKKSLKTSAKTRLAWQKPGLARVERVIRFIESLPITSGNLAGKKFRLRPFQKKIIQGIYGTDKKGVRHVRQAVLSMPRKNGKTGLTAALALCHLCGPEAIQRGQVYSAAAERQQAGLLYEEMKAIVRRVKWINDRIVVRDFQKKLEDVETGTVYFALSSDAKTKHGFSSSCWIYDELAQARDRKLYDVLSTSTAAHKEPLGIVISTQSDDPKHIMSELVDYAQQIESGVLPADPSFFGAIYTAPMDANPWDEKTWFACNPALGDFRSLEEMREYARQAQRIPAREVTFRLLYLNQRVAPGESRFVARADWDACGEDANRFDEPSLKGLPCYGAIDLSGSGRNDLTALVLVFDRGERGLKTLPFFFAAEAGLKLAEGKDRAPYVLWAKQGFLLTTPGRVLDYDVIARKLGELTKLYQVRAFGVDPWNIDALMDAIEKAGAHVRLKKHGQSYQHMDPAVKAIEDAVLSWRLRHNQHPILTWCMDNIRVTHDSSGNRKLDKRKATGRIDGAVALAMACNLAAPVNADPNYKFTLL